MRTLRSSLVSVSILSMLFHAAPLLAASGDTETGTGAGLSGQGTIIIRQVMPAENVPAEWTLLQPGNKKAAMTQDEHTFTQMPAGSYTLIATPPDGATGKLEIVRNGTTEKSLEIPQSSFTLNDGDTVELTVTFTYTRIGVVSITSDPSGLDFTLKGPNNILNDGTTPGSYENMPEGLYSVTFKPIDGCPTPKPLSRQLQKGGRADFSIKMECEALKNLEQADAQRKLQYMSVSINGKEVVYDDIPIDAWFAPYVHDAAKIGVVSGYRDAAGNITGKYGPSDLVTVAELVKIAHKIAAISVDNVTRAPDNLRARNTWFAPYIASAEDLFWLVAIDRRGDPARPATRAEVVATILQALDIPRLWPKGWLFTDVKPTMPYADAIETAATDGLIEGYVTRDGTKTGTFGPNDPINRAEIAKIITLAVKLYRQDTPEITGESVR